MNDTPYRFKPPPAASAARRRRKRATRASEPPRMPGRAQGVGVRTSGRLEKWIVLSRL